MAKLLAFSLRLLPFACLLLLPQFVPAQSSANYCEAAPAVKEEFKKLAAIDDEALPYKERRQRQLATLQELLKKHKDDFHVLRRYQIHRLSDFLVDRDALFAEYREQMQKNSNDPKAVYLYARLIVGHQTKEAIDLLQKLSEQTPDFPWTYIQLAEIYTYPNFRDLAKSNALLKQWIAKCPATMHGTANIVHSGNKDMMAAAAQKLRPRLESSMNADDLGYWSDLWTLEFKLKPVTEHAQVRQKMADDVRRIRELSKSKAQLQTLIEGYKQIGDKTGQRWAEDELMRLLPASQTARRMTESRYYEDHPYPKPEEPDAKKQAYQQALVQITSEWLKQWPHDDITWSTRVRALTELQASSNADVEAAYAGYAKAHEAGGGWYSLPPLEITLARAYLRRGFNLETLPALLQKGLAEVEQIEKRRGESDLYPRNDSAMANLKYARLEAWPMLAEVYARLKQPDKAREVLAQLAGILQKEQANDTQKRAFAHEQMIYWQATGKVAEAEQRKLDALTAYQTALTFRVIKPPKDELGDNTQRLWRELGGTDQGWQAYLARTEASKSKLGTAEIATWDTKNTALPAFDLTDLQGRKWSLADLKGKVAFINLWATWCGPCRLELPYVQKLREQMKHKKDVLILTLNTDEEIGMVEPFMKESKYNFPVLLGETYAESQGVNSIPRNWIISSEGKLMFEGIGFGNDGEEWMKRATQMIEKVRGTN
jgi:thiol-disulfide isomerase/thioredoxin